MCNLDKNHMQRTKDFYYDYDYLLLFFHKPTHIFTLGTLFCILFCSYRNEYLRGFNSLSGG